MYEFKDMYMFIIKVSNKMESLLVLWSIYGHGLTKIRAWLSNHTHFMRDVIIYPCPNFNNGFTNPPLKLQKKKKKKKKPS